MTAGQAAPTSVDAVGSRIRVEILHSMASDDLRKLVSALGGEVYGEVPGALAEALVPYDRLVELEAHPDVQYLRPPLRVDIPLADQLPTASSSRAALVGTTTGQEVTKTNADAWHAAGHTGAGVKVGIVDFFGGAKGDMDCNGTVDAVDALRILRHVAGLDPNLPPGCDPIGGAKGDMDCNGTADAVDALRILRHVAGLDPNLPPGCDPIGGAATPTPTSTGMPTPTPTPTPTLTPTPSPTPEPEPGVFVSLVNGGFEEARADGTPYGWRKVGGEMVVSDGASSEGGFSLAFSSSTGGTKWAYQTVLVEPGELYLAEAQALKNDGLARAVFLRVSWYESEDGSGEAIASTDSNLLETDSPVFRGLSTGVVRAPEEARSAKVKLMLRPASAAPVTVYFDAVTFAR